MDRLTHDRLIFVIATVAVALAVLPAASQQAGRGAAPFQPKPEELQQVKAKTEQIEGMVKDLKAKHADADLVADVDVYGKAGRMLLEFPDQLVSQNSVTHALAVLDTGIERAKGLQRG